MGRQAYLAKIAFGRSAFEPTQSVTESLEYLQLDASQSELPRAYQDASPNSYIQLYDERGNSINPRSHEYGKKLRDAQNDVLASVGVVERRKTPSDGLPGSYKERLELLEAEDAAGNAIALTSTVLENLCVWWIGTIRNRILTFRYPEAATLTQIIGSAQANSGASLLYTGFPPWLFSALSMQAIIYSALVYQPLDRLLYATGANMRTRHVLRRLKKALKPILRVALDVLFYPFSYYASLQRLGLISARPLIPTLKTLRRFSSLSHMFSLSSSHSGTAFSILGCTQAVAFSPVVFICAELAFDRWVYSCTNEAIESSIIRPDNPDMQGRDNLDRDRTVAMLGLRRQSTPLILYTINKFLTMLGWGVPLDVGQKESNPSTGAAQTVLSVDGQSLEISGTRVANLNPFEIPVSHGQVSNIDTLRPATPPTPIVSMHDQGDDDPRIRITSREGTVEMEVRLPPRILSTHIEVADSPISSPARQATSYQSNASFMSSRSYHRITQLSSEPAQMLSAIVKAQLAGLVTLPMKLIGLRIIARHYVAGQGGVNSGILVPLPTLSDLTWRFVGIQMARVALCSTLELAIDLALWGLQYTAITTVGRTRFGWGSF